MEASVFVASYSYILNFCEGTLIQSSTDSALLNWKVILEKNEKR